MNFLVFVTLVDLLQDHEVDLDSLAKLLAKYIRDWLVKKRFCEIPVYFQLISFAFLPKLKFFYPVYLYSNFY